MQPQIVLSTVTKGLSSIGKCKAVAMKDKTIAKYQA